MGYVNIFRPQPGGHPQEIGQNSLKRLTNRHFFALFMSFGESTTNGGEIENEANLSTA
jgi:hypothetical protein